MAEDNWPELLKLATPDDGLPTRTTHVGTFDKLWWWNYYISITTQALGGRTDKWPPHLSYVDLFAGPGILASLDGQRWPGSPMIAAHAAKPFRRMIFCEKAAALADACERRLSSWQAAERSVVVRGDCNRQIDRIAAEIPAGGLTLAFVDPTGLHVKFETLETLTAGRAVDLLILFADRMDIVRNVKRYVAGESAKLDGMLGAESGWRDEWNGLTHRSIENVCRMFNGIYQRELNRRLGYTVFGSEVVKLPSGRGLYTVLFASRHPLGEKFWRQSTLKTQSGGRLF